MNNKLLPLTKYFFSRGALLFIAGGIVGFYGFLRMKLFFQNLPVIKKLTVQILIKELILPHGLFLFGFGCFAFGMLLLVKGIVFHIQQRKIASSR